MQKRRMLFTHPFRWAIIVGAFLVCGTGHAQDRSGVMDRLDELETQIEILKEYRRPETDRVRPVKTNVPVSGAARFEVAITALEEEVRFLRGQLEEMAFNQRQLRADINRLRLEMDAKLQNMSSPTHAMPPVLPDPDDGVASDDLLAPQGDIRTDPAPQAQEDTTPPAARDRYDEAFKALNQSEYDQSEKLFKQFIEDYKDDPLVGNAYYWLGETHYVQRQYADAAEQFRSGFEAMPEGPKAPDNLLKLSMSLSALDRNQEACVVLNQLLKKYADDSQIIKRKATKESAKLKCN